MIIYYILDILADDSIEVTNYEIYNLENNENNVNGLTPEQHLKIKIVYLTTYYFYSLITL